jgi:nicotinate dehydrogenase subunit A
LTAINITVNGESRQLDVDPQTPLIYVLRNDLQLKGAKLGCGLEQCGACRVLVDGKAEYACATPVGAFANRAITTIEGIGTAAALHPIQQAFIAERAAQCGYCIPGMIVATKALLDANPDPDETQIRAALAGHLCRCGTHARILKAVRRAARELRA